MSDSRDIDIRTDAVYRAMIAHPQDGPPELAARLRVSEEDVRAALERLSEMALVRTSEQTPSRPRPVSPYLGVEILLAHQQAELAALQERQRTLQELASRLTIEQTRREDCDRDEPLQLLEGLDSIRDHLEALNGQVREECLTFAPGGPQTPANMQASRELCRRLLDRGVRVRTVYLDSIRRDPMTLAHAQWLTEMGGQIRTVPALPNRMVVFDRKIALVAADAQNTANGAVIATVQGVVDALLALFDSYWEAGQPLDEAPARTPGGLNRQQLEALRLMAQGRTDESIAKHLEVSTRTARRITTGILTHLGARSRFQAGVHAVQQGHLTPKP